jgi:putative transposase
MARPQRTIAPGLWHHVTHRGVVGTAIFPSPDDRAEFLDLLAHCDARFGLRTQAASLLDTSYQLLVFDASGQLGRAMRHLNGVYTQAVNRRHGSDGALFRGRYHSRVIADPAWLAPVARHIHQSPAVAGLADAPDAWPWSSHRHYLAPVAPPWLHTETLLARFAGSAADFDAFVRAPAPAAELAALASRSAVLGGSPDQGPVAAPVPGPPAAPGRTVTTVQIIDAVAAHYAVAKARITARHRGMGNPARSAALLLAVDISKDPLATSARRFDLSAQSLASLASRQRKNLDGASQLARDVAAIRAALESP